MYESVEQYYNIFQIWSKMIMNLDENSRLRVSRYRSSDELAFNTPDFVGFNWTNINSF